MPEASPWEEIGVPGADFNVRQVAGKTATPCFWGRDSEGACLFIVELDGDHTAQYRKNAVTITGVNVDLRGGSLGQQHLILTLEKQVDRDLFAGLCRTLCSALEHATDSASSLAVALTHIHRWKNFLSGRTGPRLSPEEVRGLFAELSFLTERIDRGIPAASAVESWLGPERSHQDFIFGNTAVEIKSLIGTERNAVRISSEDQLDSLNDYLFIRLYRLSALLGANGARSLNEVVAAIESKCLDAEALAAFDRKLVAYGYAPLPDYDEPRFVISEIRTYEVGPEFPRLIRPQLAPGVVKVTYDLELEKLAPFQCDGVNAFGGM